MRELLKTALPALTAEQLDRFETYYRLLIDWNTRMNLTTITEPEDVVNKHFVDSLAALPYLGEKDRIIDVGTGAGFPGVPLLILRPTLKVTLLDGLQKRITFLEALLDALGLKARMIHMRAEDAGKDPGLRGKFDAATTRAVAPLPVLLELTVPLLKVGGQTIAYKGNVQEELAGAQGAAKQLFTELSAVECPASYGARTLILGKKTAATPARFPRKAGTPAKAPLA